MAIIKTNEPDNGLWGQFIYDTIFGHLKPILSQIPSEWFYKVASIYVRNVGNIEVNMNFMLNNYQPWPCYSEQNEFAEWESTNHGVGYVSLKPHSVWANFCNAVIDYKVCKTYKTLNDALKI